MKKSSLSLRTRGASLVIAALLILALSSVATAAAPHSPPTVSGPHREDDGYKSCLKLGVAQRDYWRSFIDGSETRRGSHWVVAKSGADTSCTFARRIARELVTQSAAFYDRHAKTTHGNLKTGAIPFLSDTYCSWSQGSHDRETVEPFHIIVCTSVEPLGKDRSGKERTSDIKIEAIIFPLPQYTFPTGE